MHVNKTKCERKSFVAGYFHTHRTSFIKLINGLIAAASDVLYADVRTYCHC